MREIKFRAWLKEKKEMIDNARPDFFCKQLNYLCNNSVGGQDVLGVSTEDIEAMQYTENNTREILEWINENNKYENKNKDIDFLIEEIESFKRFDLDVYGKTLVTVELGDYVVKGQDGEFYKVKKDVFESTYEEVR